MSLDTKCVPAEAPEPATGGAKPPEGADGGGLPAGPAVAVVGVAVGLGGAATEPAPAFAGPVPAFAVVGARRAPEGDVSCGSAGEPAGDVAREWVTDAEVDVRPADEEAIRPP